jgi:DNA-binding XRE family transcriptional regulator
MASQPTSQLLQEYWGTAIRRARGSRSQMWLAREVGVDQTVISRLERGAYKLSPELMVGLAVVLGMELDDLFSFPPGLISRERYMREIKGLKATETAAAR